MKTRVNVAERTARTLVTTRQVDWKMPEVIKMLEKKDRQKKFELTRNIAKILIRKASIE
jgi:hypothetical protein